MADIKTVKSSSPDRPGEASWWHLVLAVGLLAVLLLSAPSGSPQYLAGVLVLFIVGFQACWKLVRQAPAWVLLTIALVGSLRFLTSFLPQKAFSEVYSTPRGCRVSVATRCESEFTNSSLRGTLSAIAVAEINEHVRRANWNYDLVQHRTWAILDLSGVRNEAIEGLLMRVTHYPAEMSEDDEESPRPESPTESSKVVALWKDVMGPDSHPMFRFSTHTMRERLEEHFGPEEARQRLKEALGEPTRVEHYELYGSPLSDNESVIWLVEFKGLDLKGPAKLEVIGALED